MSDMRFPPDGTWKPGPARVEITLYENRHMAHVIEIRSSKGHHRAQVSYEQRTPLCAEKTSSALRDLLHMAAPWH
jgi:hypothetical protein